MGLDVSLDARDLPRGQATLHQRRRRVRGADIIAEKRRCAGDAGPRSVAIAIDHVIRILEKFDHGRGESSAPNRAPLLDTAVRGECQCNLLLPDDARVSGRRG